MQRYSKTLLFIAFLLSCLPAALSPIIFPNLKITYFAPFLVLLFYQRSLLATLWISSLIGLSLDLVSSYSLLGMYAVNYCVTTLLLYHLKRLLFQDQLSTVPLLSFLFGIISTLIEVIILTLSHVTLSLSFGWFISDLIIMPFCDALFAFIGFVLPIFLLSHLPFVKMQVKRPKTLILKTP